MAYRGGAATWRRQIRFKHLATDLYLTVVPKNLLNSQDSRRESALRGVNIDTIPAFSSLDLRHDDENYSLILVPKESNDPTRDEQLLFVLDPCAKTSTKEARVPINSFVRLQHMITGRHVKPRNHRVEDLNKILNNNNFYYLSSNGIYLANIKKFN